MKYGFDLNEPNIINKKNFMLKQIHGNEIAVVKKVNNELAMNLTEGDAIITDEKEALVMIRTADCVPILLYDRVNNAIAAIHAGWRGTAQNIVGNTLCKMSGEFGTNTSDIRAIIGPAICKKCYEVSEEVIVELNKLKINFNENIISKGTSEGKYYIDLKKINKTLLETYGILASEIEISEDCTKCSNKNYPSYRRDGPKSGRLYSYITL